MTAFILLPLVTVGVKLGVIIQGKLNAETLASAASVSAPAPIIESMDPSFCASPRRS